MTRTRQSGAAGHANARAAIIDVLRLAGTSSRTEIGAAARLTAATVSAEVRRLIDDGLVVEVGRAPSTGGTPRRLLRLVADSRYAMGIHLDHDAVTYALVDLAGTVVARRRVPGVGERDPGDVVRHMVERVREIIVEVGVDVRDVLGLGVVAPGPFTVSGGLVMSRPVLRRWVEYPLASHLEERTGMPVMVDNDATAAAVGENWTATAERATTVSALYMATGIGSGTVSDGVAYRGASSNAGEIGHVCVELDGPSCWCGNRGCVEAVAGPAAVVAAARSRGAGGDLPPGVLAAFSQVARCALDGDVAAQEVIAASARVLGVAGQALCTVMDSDLLVLTGPAFEIAGELYRDTVAERVEAGFVARAGAHPVRVVLSQRPVEAASVGAAALVLSHLLVPRRFGVRLR